MAFDQDLADRLAEILIGEPGLSDRRMFGSFCFLLDGNICAGVSRDRVITRVPIVEYAEMLELDGVSRFPSEDRFMKGWLAIDAELVVEDDDLAEWVRRGVGVARSLPAKMT